MNVHRIPYTDFDSPETPISFVLEVTADSQEDAYRIANDIKNPAHGELPPGTRKLGMRVEEIWPFLRDDHAIRRRAWSRVQVLRTQGYGRLTICDRDIHEPQTRHVPVAPWGEVHVGSDLLAEDWEVAPTPEKFPQE